MGHEELIRKGFIAGFQEAASNTNYRVGDAWSVYEEWKRESEKTSSGTGVSTEAEK